MLSRSLLIFAIMIMAGTAVAEPGSGSFQITGDFEANTDDATASIFLNERVNIRMFQVRADRYMVTLFFSRDFTPAPGTYPIQFNYLNAKNTLGGSVIVSGDDYVMLSHDTEGTAVFEVFDEQIKGTFEFTSYDGSQEPRQQVTISGSFDMPRGSVFR